MFYKMCYSCGKKEKKLYEGLCRDCYQEFYPGVEEIKPLNLKICNKCKKIHYKNNLYTLEEIEKILPEIMRDNVVLSSNDYVIEDVKIDNLNLDGNKLCFDINIDTKLI